MSVRLPIKKEIIVKGTESYGALGCLVIIFLPALLILSFKAAVYAWNTPITELFQW